MKHFLLCIVGLLFSALSSAAGAQTAACISDTATAGTPIATGLTATSYSDTTVVDGATYGYIVTSNDPFGFACSNLVLSLSIPATGTHTVSLNWIASPTSGVTYSVFRAPPPSAPAGLAATVN